MMMMKAFMERRRISSQNSKPAVDCLISLFCALIMHLHNCVCQWTMHHGSEACLPVKPKAAGLLIGIECSRVRDSA